MRVAKREASDVPPSLESREGDDDGKLLCRIILTN
jgi:hypothetical protein